MKRSQIWYGFSGFAIVMLAIISGCSRNLTVAPTAPQATSTYTMTSVATSTFTRTATSTNTAVYTNTRTATPTNTHTAVFTNTLTNTFTSTRTATVTNTATNTSTDIPGATNTFTFTATSTPTATSTSTSTASATNTDSPTITNTPTNTNTTIPGATDTSTLTVTMTATVTATPTATNTLTSTATASSTATPTTTSTPTNSNTTIPGATDTSTLTMTMTATVTSTPTATVTTTPTLTAQPTSTSCSGTFQTAYTFDTNLECWALDSVSLPAVTAFDLSSSNVTQGTGSLHVAFSQPATALNIQLQQTYATPADLSGRTITAWVYVDATMQGGGVQFFCQSGGWSWSNSAGVYLGAAQVDKWIQISWAIAGTDTTLVDQIGIQFYGIPGSATGNLYVDNIAFSAAATPTNTPSGACTPILLNGCETLAENGTWGGSNSTFSPSTLHFTQGAGSLAVSIVTPPASGWNDQFILLSGFTPNTWTNTTQLSMDIFVDASILAGTTSNQLFLEASTGGGGWKYINANNPVLVAGQQTVTFNLDWTGVIAATDPLDQLVIVLQTGGQSGVGNVYVDNIRLIQSCP
jgi:hypothetical protein